MLFLKAVDVKQCNICVMNIGKTIPLSCKMRMTNRVLCNVCEV
jgi:hypothetical protein